MDEQRVAAPKSRRRVFAGVVCLHGFLSGQAFAAETALRNLYGFSIEASADRSEAHQRASVEGSDFSIETTTFYEQIYVSTAGRIFERQRYKNLWTHGQWEGVAAGNTQQLRYDANFGFRRTNFDGDFNKSTYMMVTDIPIQRVGSEYKCSMTIYYVLRSGNREYIKYIKNGDVWRVKPNSWSVSDVKCVVRKGNVFMQ